MKRILCLSIAVYFSMNAFAQDRIAKKYSLITDLADTSATIKSMSMLLDHLEIYWDGGVNKNEIIQNKDGLVIMLSDGNKVSQYKKLINNYTSAGGTVVMDIRDFASLNDLAIKSIALKKILVKEESGITAGYKKGEPIVYHNQGKLTGLAKTKEGISILGQSDKGEAVLVSQKRGQGRIIAVDMLSLKEPKVYADTENKYLFLVNAIGNRVKYGRFFPERLKYAAFAAMLEDLARRHPSIKLIEEGEATGGNKIYSLSMGNPAGPGIFIYSNTHGNEWENSYGTVNFIQYLAEHPDQNILDLNKYYLKVIPLLNPYGYEHMTRQNGNGVDLNRNGDNKWEQFTGQDPANYKVGVYDWKGTAPFSEPEAQTLRKAGQSGNFIAFLDIHGNPSGTGFNKSISVATANKADALEKGKQFEKIFNTSIAGRYILQQTHEKRVKSMEVDYLAKDENNPLLYLTLSKGKYGYLVELLCGYSSTQFIVMQDDLTCELCVSFCKTFAN